MSRRIQNQESETFETRSAAAHRAEPSRTCEKTFALPAHAGIDTVALRGGRKPDPSTGAILTPIFQSTTYAQEAVGVHKGHTYSRASNPTVSALEEALGALENTPPAVCFSTGLAAITTLFLSLLKSGDHAVVSDVVYGGTVRLLNLVLEPLGVAASFVDTSDSRAVEAAITPRTKLVFVETPANPTLKLADVEAIARIAKERGIPLAVDNTFLTPVLFRPLDRGADIAVYSTTKYIEGHNATVGGSISTRDSALLDRLRLFRKSLGTIQAPFDAWLTLKGLKTLPLRIRQHSRSALEVARYLLSHPKVTRVFYPGLSEFPQHELALRQIRSQHGAKRTTKNADSEVFFGGIVAFEVASGEGGSVDSGVTVMNNVQLCTLAENLGSAETLITHPASMTHGDVPREQRERTGITDGLIRLSVGLEDPADIIADLEQALDQVVIQSTTTRTTTTTVTTRGRARQLA
ncbi:MAG: aminotransferase class I/II-fold pyridoxal phosphate-dependent enzyme [Phycisphaeraceae bacterium]|nr:aminotransferase class I/II-fold pyridoxal phosphate-dependent enzyme [Phycisphaeraceae bacterium]